MNYLIPLMVVIPILAALVVNILGGKDKTVKAISLVVGIIVEIIFSMIFLCVSGKANAILTV